MARTGYENKSHSTSTSYSSNTGYRKFFFPKDVNGNTISGFADMDGNLRGTTSDGMSYIAISGENPVYVKNTLRYANPASWKMIGTGRNSTQNYGSMLPYYSWLVSPYVALNSGNDYASFGLQRVNSSIVGGYSTFSSSGIVVSYSYALRPLVSLSSTLPVVSGAGTSGSPYKLQ